IFSDVTIIERENLATADLTQFKTLFANWKIVIRNIHRQLEAGDIEGYRKIALNQAQNIAVSLEGLCDSVIKKTQEEMQLLNEEAIQTKNHAGNLMLVVITGFLLVGILV